jgi:uncharacterized membrane protein
VSDDFISRLLTVLVVLLAAGAFCCVLWIVASGHSAWGLCGGDVSGLDGGYRCRQPHIAVIFAAALLVLAVVVERYRRRRDG